MIYRFIYDKTQLAKGKARKMVAALSSLNDKGRAKTRIWYLSSSEFKVRNVLCKDLTLRFEFTMTERKLSF